MSGAVLPRITFAIPTYNRVVLLEQCLQSLISGIINGGHRDRCEIFVSNNCSSDNTTSALEIWSSKWPDIIRFVSHSQPLDPHTNIYHAIAGAEGEFIKPLNDKIVIPSNALQHLIKVVDDAYLDGASGPIVFTNGHSQIEVASKKLVTVTQLVRHASYLSTWLGSLGIWRSDLQCVGDFNRLADTLLPQVDFTLRTIQQRKAFYISNLQLFHVMPVRASGYNVAKVFGSNYAGILRPYMQSGLLTHEAYCDEMLKVFRYHILPMYYDPEGNHDYVRDGFWEHVSCLDSLFDVKEVARTYLEEYLGFRY